MTSVIVEADRSGGPLFDVLFDQDDGATRIWMIRIVNPPPVGLHHHGGDEIWRVRRGRIRITVGDERLECGAGELVVVPPHVSHGILPLEEGTEAEVIGELQMGEWVHVLDPDGTTTEVEVHVPVVPWHRPVPEGAAPTGLDELIAMVSTTAHLL